MHRPTQESFEDLATRDHRSFLNSMALQGILRGSNYGSFIRVSTPIWPDQEAALSRLDRFGEQVLARLPEMVGDADREAG